MFLILDCQLHLKIITGKVPDVFSWYRHVTAIITSYFGVLSNVLNMTLFCFDLCLKVEMSHTAQPYSFWIQIRSHLSASLAAITPPPTLL